MQITETLLGLLRERGKRGLPLKRVYRQLYNINLYLTAYRRRCSRNARAMTPGVTEETVDAMSVEEVGDIIAAVRQDDTNSTQHDEPTCLRKMGREETAAACQSGANKLLPLLSSDRS